MSRLVLILAPVGRDADLAVSVLQTRRITAEPCRDMSHLCEILRLKGNSVAAIILTEEALVSPMEYLSLTEWIEHQEPWSELPIIFLTHPGQRTSVTGKRARLLSLRSAVTVLERPVRPATLIGALRVALQSRERQYTLRHLLESQRRAGRELQRARLAAEAANRAKDQFLATLSHELRTPLNAISGWTYLMKNGRKDEALIAQGLEVLERNTSILIELISDLLDTSRIVAGTLTMEFKEVDVKQLVRASVKFWQAQATERGIVVTSLIKVPETTSCLVWGDEGRLHQILANLMSNALKFTPSGGSVTVQLRKTRTKVIIVVKDTGKGISSAFLPHIFKRFSQDQANAKVSGGLGLGLAICKHLVELHGGSIRAESTGPGNGAMIKIELRAIASKHEQIDEHGGQSALKEAMSDARLRNIKVVAVDDNADCRELLKVILELTRAEAIVVSSGEEALAAIMKVRPAVLICDLAMPEMDGYEVLKKVRCLEPEIGYLPVIAFTAAVRDEDRVTIQRAGFQAYLEKPIDPGKLVTTLLDLTNKRE